MDDPVGHCLVGNSGLPGTGRTWPGPLWRGCESRVRRCAWCPRRTAPRRTWGWGRRRPPLGAQVRARGQRAKAGLAGGGGDHAAGHGGLGGPGVGLNADVKFLLLGDFRQLPAVLDLWAGPPPKAALSPPPCDWPPQPSSGFHEPKYGQSLAFHHGNTRSAWKQVGPSRALRTATPRHTRGVACCQRGGSPASRPCFAMPWPCAKQRTCRTSRPRQENSRPVSHTARP